MLSRSTKLFAFNLRSFAVTTILARACLILVGIALHGAAIDRTSASEAQKRVLVLSAADSNLPPAVIVEQSLRSALKKGLPYGVQVYAEYLDTDRTQVGDYEQELIAVLRRKYANLKPDLIFAIDTSALRVLLRNQSVIFEGTPIVFLSIDKRDLDGLVPGPNVTGVWGEVDLKPNLELALNLHPGTQRVVVVGGVNEFDKFWLDKAREEFRSFEGKLEFTYLIGLTIPEYQKALANLSQNTVVYYLFVTRDNSGTNHINIDVLREIAPSANVPIYGTTDLQLGLGIVGGRLLSFEALGTQLAQTGLRVLAGERPDGIAPYSVPSVTMFDWRQLQRWGIAEQNLPGGSIIRFKEQSMWALYKGHVIAGISFAILEAILIVGLLLSRARRRRAELERERFAKLAETERKSLEEIITNVPGSVWESMIEPGTTTRTTRFVSQNVERMLGYSVEDWLSTPGFGMKVIHEDDRERVSAETEAILQSGKDGILQFRSIRKDGQVIWQEAHESAILDEQGKPIGLSGVTLDITERKLAEESLRQSEDRNRAILRAIPDLMFLQTLDGTYLDYHASDPNDLLTPPETFLGKNIRDVLPPDLVEGFLKCFRLAEESCAPQLFEYEMTIQGETRWFEARMVRTNGSKVLSVVRDVTIRKQSEESLRQSEERFRTMADTAPVMIWMSGPDRNCTYINQQWLDFTGRTVEEEMGDGWASGIYAGDHARCIETYDLAFAQRKTFNLEYRLRRADGQFRWVYDTGTPRFSSSGEFLGFIGSCLDISDRKQGEVDLQRAVEEVSELKNQLQAENIYLQEEIKLAHNFDEIIGESDSIKYVLYKIEQVAPTNSTVLISGETGTGKELVARAIHSTSLRNNRPLVKVNCAALSAGLIESELFGHEKGSFTGAMARKIGRFELANGATIFLDEIGELPIELQVKLLRVIQEGEFERLGSSKTVKADVRIIAATNRQLNLEVQKGNFREDLWYRLNVFPITVPPLRQRVDDIPRLVEHFAMKFSKKIGREISSVSPATLRALANYSWPGNIRELANLIEREVINTHGTVLRISDYVDERQIDGTDTLKKTLEEIERDHIVRMLSDSGWRIEGPHGAAKVLGLNPSTLRTRMVKLRIQKPNQTVA